MEEKLFTQSVYYSPAFNSAIFDGNIRIYFAQCQEATALKLYFELQEWEAHLRNDLKNRLLKNGFHLFILIYPTQETFSLSFEGEFRKLVESKLGNDYIIGLCGPVCEDSLPEIFKIVRGIYLHLKNSPSTTISKIPWSVETSSL